MTYAKVINGEIVENNRTLPFSTDNTSFGVNTSVETMREFGYLPIVGSEPILTVNQRVNGVSYVVGIDEVSKVYDIVVVTDEELFKATVPPTITKVQAMRAMKQTDIVADTTMWTSFQVLISSNIDANDEWLLALELQRNHTLVLALTPALGKTERQIDELFILGATL